MRRMFVVVLLSGVGGAAIAQTMAPAPVLQIIREVNKEGRDAAHEKIETEWAAAARKANHPARYAGYAAISGPSEFWFVEPMASFGTFEDWDKASSTEPYKTITANLNARDGEVRASSRTYWAVYRSDLSYNADKFNPAKHRYVGLTTARVRVGHDGDFDAGAKQYFDAWRKAGLDVCVLGYQVVAGAPDGTYFLITIMNSMKDMDGEPARMQAVAQAMGPENYARFMRSGGDVFTSIDFTLLQAKPDMSYVPKEMADADPFWKPKASMPAPKKAAQ